MEETEHAGKTMDELLASDHYTPAELALLLDMNVNTILTACFEGRLKASIVEHDVVSITRDHALEWLNSG